MIAGEQLAGLNGRPGRVFAVQVKPNLGDGQLVTLVDPGEPEGVKAAGAVQIHDDVLPIGKLVQGRVCALETIVISASSIVAREVAGLNQRSGTGARTKLVQGIERSDLRIGGRGLGVGGQGNTHRHQSENDYRGQPTHASYSFL